MDETLIRINESLHEMVCDRETMTARSPIAPRSLSLSRMKLTPIASVGISISIRETMTERLPITPRPSRSSQITLTPITAAGMPISLGVTRIGRLPIFERATSYSPSLVTVKMPCGNCEYSGWLGETNQFGLAKFAREGAEGIFTHGNQKRLCTIDHKCL